jgi:hypothetical protein
MRPTHNKYFHSEPRSLITNCQNERAVIVSAGIPEYVSMRQRKYGDCHGRRRYPRVEAQRNRSMDLLLKGGSGPRTGGFRRIARIVSGARPHHRLAWRLHRHLDLPVAAVQRLN